MSGRVVQFVVRFGYRFSSDFTGRHGTQKKPSNRSGSRAFWTLSDVLEFPSGGEGGIRTHVPAHHR